MSETSFPSSEAFSLQETKYSGRGVFATKPIPAGTPLLSTNLLPAHVVYREYKKEVCGQCFAYEQSRTHKLRIAETGHSFCSKDCLRAFKADAGSSGLEAWKQVEDFVKTRNGKTSDRNRFDALPDEGAERPSPEAIAKAWEDAEATARLIRLAREGSKQKVHRKALQNTMALGPYPDTLTFLLSGFLTTGHAERSSEWETVIELVKDDTPYTSPNDLDKNVRSYLQLLCVVPLDLLPQITGKRCLTLVSRDSHNSFGIRSLDDNGAEMFGYGIWPLASYFNHSCSPNVGKKRVGRGWEFWTSCDVEAGEELCITYMGGDEMDLNLVERRRRSEDIWGFTCGCARCVGEDEIDGTSFGSGSS